MVTNLHAGTLIPDQGGSNVRQGDNIHRDLSRNGNAVKSWVKDSLFLLSTTKYYYCQLQTS
jgi:hypothetical protein